jgi:sugar phosphate isomerase/epimerase
LEKNSITSDPMTTRRNALQLIAASAASASLPALAKSKLIQKFPIGACDWSIGHKQHIDAFSVAKEIGLEGLQVSFSNPGSEFDLRDKAVREQYYKRIDETGIRIASLGMGILNQQPLATNHESLNWVADAIVAMSAMQHEEPDKATNVCLLAFFGKGDINGKPDLMESVISKLKTIAPIAEEHGVVFGIESLLSADDHLRIIDGVDSTAIQVYYDSANSNRMGYDIYEEVVRIGAERICQVHAKENGALIGEGVIDFPKFRDSLEKAGYDDWLIIEGSTPKGGDIVEAYRNNLETLDGVFRSA